VIELVEPLQQEFLRQLGTRFAWLADEWFLIAGQPLPPAPTYEDYPQLEDGVGSIQSFLQAFDDATQQLPTTVSPPRRFTWVVGNVVRQAFEPIATRLNQVEGLSVRLVGLASGYWGQALTVTGLLTGQDLLEGLKDQPLGEGVLLPSVMLKPGEEYFLDDMTVAQVREGLGCPVFVCEGIAGLLYRCLM
jgi:putative radical SAM enzyme (TIGR03279 family)